MVFALNHETADLVAAKARLGDVTYRFRLWADKEQLNPELSGEWETNYESWPEIIRAVSDLLDAARPDELTGETASRLLYLLARDNEFETIKYDLGGRPDHLLALAEMALRSSEQDARWQIADALGDVEAPDEVIAPILEKFLEDSAEYVSRRALSALARRATAIVEPWAVRAWETGEQYQRMAALDALASKNSPLLSVYLDHADADGREYLVGFAQEIRDRQPGS